MHTGLRVSEAVGLRIEDIVIKERSGSVRVMYGKGNNCREIPLNITIRKALVKYIESLGRSTWLFSNKKGGHISSRSAENILSKYGKLAGINVTPHQLRHTFGKMLIDAGESMDRVAALMGHRNLNTTAQYTIPSHQDLQKAVDN